MKLADTVYDTITRYNMIGPGDSIVLGVSGGPDSVALLYLLDALKHRLGCTLAVAHLDHGIRGAEGREDALFVEELAGRLDLPFHLGRSTLAKGAGRGSSGNLEARARQARYEFLESVARRLDATKIAVGHTRDDQVETMLMWLLRGCGASGLGGMPAVRAVNSASAARQTLIRPLIESPRTSIIRWLEDRGHVFRRDSTNMDTRYLRNWIRSNLLPALVERTDSRLQVRLARLSSLLQSDEVLLAQYTCRAASDVIVDGEVLCARFLGLEPELRARVVRLWLGRRLGDLRGLGFHHVESVIRLAAARRPSGRVSLPRGWTAVRDYDVLRLVSAAESGQPNAAYVYDLPLAGEVRVREAGVRVRTWCSSREEALAVRSPFRAVFDRDRVHGRRRQLRNRLPGDRFQPLGMPGHKKVKDLFIDKKIPRSLRDSLPLVLVDGEIVWIPGYGRSATARVVSGTREVWNVDVSPLDLGKAASY